MTKTGMAEDVLAHVKDFYISGAGQSSPLIVAMTSTFKSEISIGIGQSLADHVFIQSMEEVLKENGIAYILAEAEVFPEMYFLQ